MFAKKGIIVCFLLVKIEISFSCLPPNKPTNEPTCRGVRCEKTCKTEDGKDCDFKAVYFKDNIKKARKATTCSSYEEDGKPSTKPWCFTDAEKKITESCKNDCPGVEKESMETNKRNMDRCECGVRNRDADKRIVLGTEAKLGEFPWQVGILKKVSPSDVFSQACGGALVGEKHVVTAAHCLFKEDPNDDTKRIQIQPEDRQVVIGATNLVVDEQKISETERIFRDLSEIRMHPEYSYDNSKKKNDIAVLVLAKPVDLHRYPNIKPVCLPLTSRIKDFVGREATVMGWGRTGREDKDQDLKIPEPGTSNLKFATVEIQTDCRHGTKDSFCAQGKKKSEETSYKVQGPCKGDSGGPLVIQKEEKEAPFSLIGVVSYNHKSCSDKEYPSIYADVSYFLHEDGWLMTALMDGRTCGGAPIIPITGDDTPNKVFYESLFRFRPKDYPEGLQSTPDAKGCQERCKLNAKCQSWTWTRDKKNCQLSTATKLDPDRGTKHIPE